MLFALGAAACWALYILSAASVGRAFEKLDGLALAMMVGAAVALPFGFLTAGTAILRPEILLLGAAVALLSSTIPYALELVALRRITPAVFGILMSLAPATAALAGFVLLQQHLTWLELVGIALVVLASAGAVWAGRERPVVSEPVA
nr:EamA family transporter [Microbacterium sp. NIBRBAC000506063]